MTRDNDLKGNWGEQLVAAKLAASNCFIRHVPQGHDTGIDLYCETTDKGRPFLHFWCQVKVRSSYKSAEKVNSYNATKEEIQYWANQPVPVVIILLPNERQNENVPLFVCPPQAIVLNYLEGKQTLNSMLRIKTNEEMRDFLKNQLPLETFIWEASQGKIAPLRTTNPSYTVTFPTDITHRFDTKLLTTIKHTLWRLSEDLLNQVYDINNDMKLRVSQSQANEAFKKSRPYMRALEMIGGNSKEEGRGISGFYELANRALRHELDGNLKKAKDYFLKARNSIEGDQTLQNETQEKREGWDKRKKKMEGHMERIQNRLKLQKPKN